MTLADPVYAQTGVDQRVAGDSVAAIVDVLSRISLGRPSRQCLGSGHFANVIKIDERIGIALSTDGVGTKTLIAAQLGRYDTIGVDCIAMNVNDVICVGAEPLAMLDYIAIDKADPEISRQIAEGLRRGAELAQIEIPGGELAQLGDVLHGFDLVGACFGIVELNRIITGSRIEPGDVLLGLPSSGIHANGYTLARKALEKVSLEDKRLGRPLGEILLEPTEIYVRPIIELIRSPVDVRGLAHITSDGLDNLVRLDADVTYRVNNQLPVPEIFNLIQELGEVSEAEMYEVFNMGCGFCCVVAESDEEKALEILRQHYPNAQRIGYTSEGPREVVRG